MPLWNAKWLCSIAVASFPQSPMPMLPVVTFVNAVPVIDTEPLTDVLSCDVPSKENFPNNALIV